MANASKSQQYREVKRKAAVGERIKVVAIAPGSSKNGFVHVGEELTVKYVDSSGDIRSVREKELNGILAENWTGFGREYVVLEPVTRAASSPDTDALSAAFRQFVLDNADAIRAILPALEGLYGPTGLQLSAEPPIRLTQKPLTRAEVIAKATADVAELLRQNHPLVGGEGAWFTDTDSSCVTDRAEFIVNREKRAVTALLRYTDDNKVWHKATAKAAPDDVFHAEIGKAIALRRALGLTVPDEYMNAPKPDEPRVGAVAVWHSRVSGDHRTTLTKRASGYDGAGHGYYAFFHTAYGGWIADKQYDVIDDTDVDYSTAGTEAAA
ncbi:hypothetical protein D3C81_1241490 [compost metagenome]